MKSLFKKHLLELNRKRMYMSRDTEGGVCLDRNERPTKFSNKILSEIFEKISGHTLNFYPDSSILYEKLSCWLGISKEHIYVTSGITEGIRIVFETLTKPGDEVVMINPTFLMYNVYSKIYQTTSRNINYTCDLKLNVQDIYKAINDSTALVCIVNPSLPIESVLSPEVIGELAEKCQKYNAVLIVDEAYCFFGAPSVTQLVDKYDNLIVFQTFAKAFGLAGIRLGWMVSQPESIAYLSKTRSIVETNAVAIAIGEYMLENINILHDYVKEVSEGKEYMIKALGGLGLSWFGAEVTNAILIFLRDEKEVRGAIEYLRREKIYVQGSFSEPISKCIRVTIGPVSLMEKFISVFSKWLVINYKE